MWESIALKEMMIDSSLKDLGFAPEDIEKLTELAFNTPSLGPLLSLAPVEAIKEIVRQIYCDNL